jgi:hypothetical protein
MTLRTFMYAADWLRLDDGVGFVMPTDKGVPAPSPADVKKQNSDAMAQLMAGMSGVQGAPRVRR